MPGIERLIEWTGERCVPWVDDVQLSYEHFHRYLFAAHFAGDARVADLGSGEGYGAAILADHAAEVVGIEIDPDSVAHSKANHTASNLSFVRGSITDAGVLAANSIDLVTCFETIEHIGDHDGLLENVVRMLVPNGIAMISTPEREVYGGGKAEPNPFHVRELSRREFWQLLRRYFEHVVLLGQAYAVGSQIRRLGRSKGPAIEIIAGRFSDGIWQDEELASPAYLLAVASNSPLPAIPGISALIDNSNRIVWSLQDKIASLASERTLAAGQASRELERANALAQQLSRIEGLLTQTSTAMAAAISEATLARLERFRLTQRETALEERLDQLTAECSRLELWANRSTEALRNISRNSASVITEATAALKERQILAAAAAELEARNARLLSDLDAVTQRANHLSSIVDAVEASKGWRALQRFRESRARLRASSPPKRLVAPSNSPVLQAQDPPPVHRADEPTSPSAPTATIRAAKLKFTIEGEPRISVVIPFHNQVELTLACLDALSSCTDQVPYEVILVDDASDPDATDLLSGIHEIRLLKLGSRGGFTGAARAGAEAARADLIFFLNNDAEVQENWLPPLLATMGERSEVGAVGSKLLFSDGSLQEAGSLVWANAYASNIGRGASPDAPEYNYVREVDYCSMAALLVRKSAYEEVGGIDTTFSPGYYEDADLCYALAQRGYKVLYVPKSVVVHRGGGSFSDEANPPPGLPRDDQLEASRNKFAAKWNRQLQAHLPYLTANGLIGSRKAGALNILIADNMVPAGDQDAGGLRMTEIINALADLGCKISLLPHNLANREPYTGQLQDLGVEVIHGPRNLEEFFDQRRGLYDLAMLSRPEVCGDYLPLIRRTSPRTFIIYDTVDLHHLRDARRRQVEGIELDGEYHALFQHELRQIKDADLVSVVSPDEEIHIKQLAPETPCVVLPTCHRVFPDGGAPFESRQGLLFIGSFAHPPNLDGLLWFAQEIMPILLTRMDFELTIIGSNPPPELLALGGPNIKLAGWIQDVTPYFTRARVFVAPLRYGAGMKGKVGQAMGFGLPVVTTTIGAEGIGMVSGVHGLIGDDPGEFADAIVRLCRSPELWHQISTASRRLVADRFGPDQLRSKLSRLLAQLAPPRTRIATILADEQ